MTFDFWSNLFRAENNKIWNVLDLRNKCTTLRSAFPNLPSGEGRSGLQRKFAEINKFRNRVAHHEPVYKDINHQDILDKIIGVISLCNKDTAQWVKSHSTVQSVIRTKPNKSAYLPGKLLNTIKFVPPPILKPSDSLQVAMGVVSRARPAVGLIECDATNPVMELVTLQMIVEYLSELAAGSGGIVDVGETTVADVLRHRPPVRLDAISINASTGDAAAKFFRSASSERPQVLLVQGSDGGVLGVLTRPDIRY